MKEHTPYGYMQVKVKDRQNQSMMIEPQTSVCLGVYEYVCVEGTYWDNESVLHFLYG